MEMVKHDCSGGDLINNATYSERLRDARKMDQLKNKANDRIKEMADKRTAKQPEKKKKNK